MLMKKLDKKLIIFDLDGTLVDSMKGFCSLAAKVIHQCHGMDLALAESHYKATSGLPFSAQLQKIFPSHAANALAAAMFDDQKRQHYFQTSYFPEVKSALLELVQDGYHLAVSSNNDDDLVHKKLADEKNLFKWVLGFKPGFSKGRDHFHFLQQSSGYDLSKILFVGDSLHDASLASQSGIDFVARCGTFSQAEWENAGCRMMVDNLEQLVQMLAHVSAAQNIDKDASVQESYSGSWKGHPLGIPDGGLA